MGQFAKILELPPQKGNCGKCYGQYNRIADRVLELGFFPEIFRLVDFEPERSQGLRRMLVDNYSVFYVFKEEVVTVTRVLYSASDIEKRLFYI